MKDISQQEFEDYIIQLIEGKITKVELTKILHTDLRTLKNKIYGLGNQEREELLQKYIEKYPYRPKEDKHINYEALVIEMITGGLSVTQTISKYNIAERTYRRHIKKLEETNNKLYNIYKNYIAGKITQEDMDYIEDIEGRKVFYTNNVETRKAELMNLFRKYYEYIKMGHTPQQAMEELGETTKSLTRKNNELDQILYDEKVNQQSTLKSEIDREPAED